MLRAITNPWAFAWMRPLTGGPTLVGTWYGEITTATGRKQWITLELDAHFHACQGGGVTGLCAASKPPRACAMRTANVLQGGGKTEDWRRDRIPHFRCSLPMSVSKACV